MGEVRQRQAPVHQYPVLVPHCLTRVSFVPSWFCKKLPEKELYLPLIYHPTQCRMPRAPRHLSPHWDPVNPHSNHMAINQPYQERCL